MKSIWPTKKLGEICEIRMGETLIKKDLTGDGVPVYSADSLEKPWGFTSKNRLSFSPGTIIVAARGTIGFVKLPSDKKFTSTQTTIAVKPRDKNILSRFLFYFLKKFDFLKLKARGSIPMLTIGKISQVEIPLPLLSEQKKIVYVLDSIQEAVKVEEKIIEKTKKLKKSLMADLFKHGGPSFRKGRKLKKTEIGEIPEDWEVAKLGKMAEITSSKRIFQSEYTKDGIPFYRTKEIVELSESKPISLELFISESRYDEIKEKFGVPQKNDLLISAIGTIGNSWVVHDNRKFYFKDGNLLWIRNLNNLFPYYLKFTFDFLLKLISGLPIGTTYKALTIDALKNLKIPLPPFPEQRRIAEILQTIDHKIEIEQKKKALYEELCQVMLNRLMRGEIKVNNVKFQ